MTLKVCLGAYTLRYIKGGAYMWAFLNWALGLRSLGSQVTWLDSVTTGTPRPEIEQRVSQLKERLLPFGLAPYISVIEQNGNPIDLPNCLSFDEVTEADIFFNLGYDLSDKAVSAFLEYAELPRYTSAKLELAIPLSESEDVTGDRCYLEQRDWSVRHVFEVSISPQAHQAYIQQSRGEFSCMKRAYVLLETAWISERTINYLASGKPALVQFTGPSRFLPDCEGLLRFRNFTEAVHYLALLEKDYESHSRAARQLAEEFFEAKKVIQRAIELSVI